VAQQRAWTDRVRPRSVTGDRPLLWRRAGPTERDGWGPAPKFPWSPHHRTGMVGRVLWNAAPLSRKGGRRVDRAWSNLIAC